MKYVISAEDRAKGHNARRKITESERLRRDCELELLNKLYAEAAMPEWYPHQ